MGTTTQKDMQWEPAQYVPKEGRRSWRSESKGLWVETSGRSQASHRLM